MNLESGKVLAGKYRLESLLGRGGMGEVWKATHLALKRTVAVKLLRQEWSSASEYRVRFVREARVTSQLNHPHAVEIHDFGEEDEVLYLVMELLDGEPLDQMLGPGRPIEPMERALEMARQLADVLVAAHQLSLVHRDLKPENVMITRDASGAERVVVVDFGLAFLSESGDLNRMTQEGIVSGTPMYLSPEQAVGSMTIGPPSDIYSFGCMFYEMLCGDPPFQGKSTLELLNSHLFASAPSLSSRSENLRIPGAVEDLVQKMMGKDAGQRPNAEQVRDRLDHLLVDHDPRDRGRPERMLAPREHRALTQRPEAPVAFAETLAGTAPAASQSDQQRARVGLYANPAQPNWTMALRGSGFDCVELQEVDDEAEFDILVLVKADVNLVESSAERAAVIASADPSDLDAVTELMRAGAADVVVEPVDPTQLVRKVQRIWKRMKRRSEKSS